MGIAVWLGRVIFAIIWGVLAANIVAPFPGKWFAFFLLLTAILVILHAIQLLMFVTVYKPHLQWRGGDYWQVIFFGVVGWMAIMRAQPQRIASQATTTSED